MIKKLYISAIAHSHSTSHGWIVDNSGNVESFVHNNAPFEIYTIILNSIKKLSSVQDLKKLTSQFASHF